MTHDLATDSSETPDQLPPRAASSTVIVDRPDNSQPDSNRQRRLIVTVDSSEDLPEPPQPERIDLPGVPRQSTMSATHNRTRHPPDLTTESEVEASQATSTTGATATCPGLFFQFLLSWTNLCCIL